jgi:serine O-acetyltransferase
VLRHIPLIHIFVQRCTELTSGISIPPTVIIGKGLLIEHFGGIMMNAKTKIGDYCTISHGVTIGNQLPGGNAPTIGNKVYICPGAVLVGEIHIGDNSIIGANAVVLNSFAEGSVIGGVPAKLIGKVTDKEEYEKFFE